MVFKNQPNLKKAFYNRFQTYANIKNQVYLGSKFYTHDCWRSQRN